MSTEPKPDPRPLFAHGERTEMYADRSATYPTLEGGAPVAPSSPPPPAAGVIRGESPRPIEPLTGPVIEGGSSQELVPATRRNPRREEAPGLWQRLMIRIGAAQAPPTDQELEDVENERIIRQSTWTRAMSVVVVNPKGQSAKTPLTVLLAGALADVRGGGVVAWEATEVPGDLSDVAEGTPPRGLTELIAGIDTVESAGSLAGYTSPQSSHAAVIGSVSNRQEMTTEEVRAVRKLLGTYYQIDVADTANNLQRPMMREVLGGADAVVVPCVVNHKSARGLQKAMRAIESNGIPSHRVVLVITHDGGSEDEEFLQHLREQLAQNYRVRALIEVPHDPAIRRDGELTYSDLLPVTRHTIRRLARHVVEALNDAPTTKPNLTLTESE